MFFIKAFIIILITSNTILLPQDTGSPASLNSPENIISFADFLFCSKDYFRASLEYEKYLQIMQNDTVSFKAALGYSGSGNYEQARKLFLQLSGNSSFADAAMMEYLKTDLIYENYDDFIIKIRSLPDDQDLSKLLYAGILLKGTDLPLESEYHSLFKDDKEMLDLAERKIHPVEKSPFLAGILSAVIPGAGKIYTGRYVDGIFSFISTGVMAFLAYDNLRAEHKFRGCLFTGLALLFNAGNIYGSVVSAYEFNYNLMTKIDEELRQYLEKRNYFIPQYEFCR